MPRISGTADVGAHYALKPLVDELAEELRSPKEFGWPLVIETPIPRSASKTLTVIWDTWQPYTDEFRIDTALEAYRQVEGPAALEQVALVEALTVPEARDAGRLPFRVEPFVRRDDLVTVDDCRKAMIDLGASTLENPERPEFRFPTEQMAKACQEALIKALPRSDNVWTVVFEGSVPAHRDAFLPRP